MDNLKWQSRYSSTPDPDERGRWARLLYFKNMLIVWVSMIHKDQKEPVFVVKTFFPLPGNGDGATASRLAHSEDEAKKIAEGMWQEFLELVRE